jgi:hypothetical protein
VPNFGHIASLFTEQPEAGSRLINAFFASGRVDTSLYQPQAVDFAPAATATAKMLAGAMLGLASLTLLSLAWMVRRVRTRDGWDAGRAPRCGSLGALVLGLGWP